MSFEDKWRKGVLDYASGINAYVEEGERLGWENVSRDPPDLEPSVQKHAGKVLKAVRDANAEGQAVGLAERLPPSHRGLVDMLDEKGQSLRGVILLPNGDILLRTGAPYQEGRVWQISGDTAAALSDDISFVGTSADKRWFAIAKLDGIHITDGWNGVAKLKLAWPKDYGALPEGVDPARVEQPSFPSMPTELIVFPEGDRVLLVSSQGSWVIGADKADCLMPTAAAIKDWYDYIIKDGEPGEMVSFNIDMEHGAVSPDGKWLIVGGQDSSHTVLSAETLQPVAEIDQMSEYPHYAQFTEDSAYVAVNSCHFYSGGTAVAATRLFPAADTLSAWEDESGNVADGLAALKSGARVYAGASHGQTLYIGDAGGYLFAHSVDGEILWRHFVGSSFSSIDVSADGKTIVAATYAGLLVILGEDGQPKRDFEIGHGGGPRELRRWLFWQGETPLLWA